MTLVTVPHGKGTEMLVARYWPQTVAEGIQLVSETLCSILNVPPAPKEMKEESQ